MLNSLKKSTLSIMTALILGVGLTGCSDKSSVEIPATNSNSGNAATFANNDHWSASDSVSTIDAKPKIVIKVGYMNKEGEPIDVGMERWRDEVRKRSNGAIALELYPADSLGLQKDLIERMRNGENIITLANAADLYGMGAYDLGIMFGPYLFDNYDEAYHLTNSKWFKKEGIKLQKNIGLRIISPKWSIGERHIFSTRPINSVKDLEGLKIRTARNDIQEQTWKNFGAETVNIALKDAANAMRNKTLDAVENPIAPVYAQGIHKVAPYLLLTSHSYSLTNIVMGEAFAKTLSPQDYEMLKETCDRTAEFYNVVLAATEYTNLQDMIKEGVKVTYPDQQTLAKFSEIANSFYGNRLFTTKWSPGLYYKTLGAKYVPWAFYTNREGDKPQAKVN